MISTKVPNLELLCNINIIELAATSEYLHSTLSLQGVLLTCFCVLGILANTITIIVLSRYNVPSTFTNLLTSLAVIDTILLVVFLVDSGLERLEVDMEWYTHLIPVVHAIKVCQYLLHIREKAFSLL